MAGTGSTLSHREWWVWAIALFICASVQIARTLIVEPSILFFPDTDDAMRLVVVKDFLSGQNWYDLTAYRLNTPYGGEIHWSRFVDVPIAAVLASATSLWGPVTALSVTGFIWPLALLAVLLYLSARIAKAFAGPEGVLPGLVLPAINPILMAEFMPGRMDHHSVVILLTLACLLSVLVSLRRTWAAVFAGLFAGIALGVAVEAAPLVVGAILAFGLLYVFDSKHKNSLSGFGLGFAASTALSFALTRWPDRWGEAACDMISPVYVLAAALVGLAYLIVATVPAPKTALLRFGLLALLGGAVLVSVIFLYPQCLGGPYGELHPWLVENWLNDITEAQPWHVTLFTMPDYAIVVAIPVALAIGISCWALWRETKREPWLVLLCFLVLATLAMLAQVRGARLATTLAVPVAAWLIVKARQHYLAKPKVISTLALLGSWLAFSGVVLTVLVNLGVLIASGSSAAAKADAPSKLACLLPGAFVDLAALPPERIMTPIDLGAHMLLYTHHEVVAAPYHRNEQAVLDAFRFFSRSADEAREMAQKRGLSLVVICPQMSEMRGNGVRTQGTLLHHFANGTLPGWLTEVSSVGPLRVFSIALN